MLENRDIVIKGKGIKIRVLFIVFLIIGVITMVASFIVSKKLYAEFDEMESAYQLVETESNVVTGFKTASDYLTDRARAFVATGNIEDAANYFVEKNELKNRELTLEQIESVPELNFESNLLEDAMKLSEALVLPEIHAMKLIAEAKHIDPSQLPAEVAAYKLTDEDAALSDIEKQSRAINLVFGDEYNDYKRKINLEVESAIVLIKEETGTIYREDEADLIRILNIGVSLVIVLFILLVLIFVFDIFLVVKPVKLFVKALNERKKLPVVGGYELRKFARRYDEIYGSNWKHIELLKEHDEVDELTGTLKVTALDYVRNSLTKSDESLGIMLVDIDGFRAIKETSGYDMAEKVVAKVAGQLISVFQGGDYIVRISQDEFEIFLNKMKPDKAEMLIEKIDQINRKLADGSDGVATASVSAGVAFSENGYTKDTEKEADMALNHVKGNGRGACQIGKA